MSELLNLLSSSITDESASDDVAILLSGGIDSVSVGIALAKLGKRIRAYTYELDGYSSADKPKAIAIAQWMGWPITTVPVPANDLRRDFLRLAIEDNCRSKVHFEVLFPLLYILPAISEVEIWSGWNADDHYGNSKKQVIRQWQLKQDGVTAEERKRDFDNHRTETFRNFDDPNSDDTWWYARRLAERHGKRLVDPYTDRRIRIFFGQYSHDELSDLKKPVVRAALKDELRGLPGSNIAVGVQLQHGGGISSFFQRSVEDPFLNRFEARYSSVRGLCQRWAKEVANNRAKYASELKAMKPAPTASRSRASGEYVPFFMSGVREASSQCKFTVISTFSGGGGSSIGYRLAGGQILLANEFVPEAARTYETNFPETPLDRRDIREILKRGNEIDDLLNRVGLIAGEPDVLEGSPPCSEFSVAGKGMSELDKVRSYSDVQQRSIATLPFDCIEFASQINAKTVVIENVPGLTWSRSRELFERILAKLRFPLGNAAGQRYFVAWSVLRASDFGVPQRRNRLFIIGVRSDVGKAVGIDRDTKVASVFPYPTSAELTVRSALQNVKQTSQDILPWIKAHAISSIRNEVQLLPKCPSKPVRLADVIPGYPKSFTLSRASWDHPAQTLVVTSQRPDGMTGIFHPDDNRKFTIPELKRLTGLPDDYVLTGTLSQAAERVCRMVPPFMTKAIAESIYERVLRPYKEGTR